MENKNPITTDGYGRKYRPLCSGWKVFPPGKQCKGCPDCKSETIKNQKMATKKKSTAKKRSTAAKKKPTAKQLAARKKFAERAKKAGKLVRDGKAKTMKAAFKKVK